MTIDRGVTSAPEPVTVALERRHRSVAARRRSRAPRDWHRVRLLVEHRVRTEEARRLGVLPQARQLAYVGLGGVALWFVGLCRLSVDSSLDLSAAGDFVCLCSSSCSRFPPINGAKRWLLLGSAYVSARRAGQVVPYRLLGIQPLEEGAKYSHICHRLRPTLSRGGADDDARPASTGTSAHLSSSRRHHARPPLCRPARDSTGSS